MLTLSFKLSNVLRKRMVSIITSYETTFLLCLTQTYAVLVCNIEHRSFHFGPCGRKPKPNTISHSMFKVS